MRRLALAAGVFLLVPAISASWLLHRASRYNFIISQASARNGVDFYLAKALIYEESWFRPDIRGPAGEMGLMQITKAAASDFAVCKGFPEFYDAQLLEPEMNAEIGCWYLKRSLDRYRDSPAPVLFALLRYNAGESRTDAWLQIARSAPPPAGVSAENYYLSMVDFPKTRAYARKILRRFRTHNFLF
jgi:soluble lytic murein transglycosylase